MTSLGNFDRRTFFRGGLAVTAVGAATALGAAPAIARTANTSEPLRTPFQAQEPLIHNTEAWGARPPNGTIDVLDDPPTYIVVHHTVEPGNTDDFSLERAYEISRAIQNFHMDSRGWVDSGQQFTNSRGGHITEGRHRSLEILRGGTQHVLGANVGDYNSVVIGIENEGLYTEEDVTQPLWDSLVDLVAYMASQYGIGTENIMGHRDFNATECPGGVLYGRLPELREAVGAALGVPVRHPMTWPLLKPGDTGENVRTAQGLLRARGASGLPVDGVFGRATANAVAEFATAHGVRPATCYAAAHASEHGYLGANLWPLLGARRADLT